MKLLVDIGNTRIKWASRMDDAVTATGSFAHAGDPDAAVFAFLDHYGQAPDSVLVANVAGKPFADAMSSRVRERWKLEVRFATAQPAAGPVRNAYEDYAKLGVDRWLAILAAAQRHAGSACVVDAGTAVTIDLVAAGGEHRGGYIVPGLDMAWRALTEDTGDLANLAGGGTGRRFGSLDPGSNTADAIGHGSLATVCTLIERCAGALAGDNRGSIVVLTGGDAERIIPHLSVDLDHRPWLVLEGLALWRPG